MRRTFDYVTKIVEAILRGQHCDSDKWGLLMKRYLGVVAALALLAGTRGLRRMRWPLDMVVLAAGSEAAA